jgi:DNA-binding SARP family transcriptional activator
MLHDYAKRDTSRKLVEVRTFGNGAIHVNGRELDKWNGILPRLLFFYLADQGMATRDDIFTTFWSNQSIKDATNVFHVTKRKITSKLNEPLTQFEAGYYHISPNIDLSYDAALFSTAIENSTTRSDDEAVRLLETAVNLYRAPFLSTENDPNHSWIIQRRDALNKQLGEAFTMLADRKLSLGDHEQALNYYLNALRILTHHEDIVIKAMKLYHMMGQTADALNLYRWLEHNLQTDYGIAPSINLQTLAETMRQNPNGNKNRYS